MTSQHASSDSNGTSTQHIAAGAGRRLNILGNIATLKLTGEETGEAYAVWEDTVPSGGGPPPHRHRREHEDFYILEGEFEFFRDGQPPVRGSVGDFVHTPIGVTHTFKNVGAGTGRLLAIASPAGIERFFAEVGEPAERVTSAPAGPPTAEQIDHLVRTAERYGIEIMVPGPHR